MVRLFVIVVYLLVEDEDIMVEDEEENLEVV